MLVPDLWEWLLIYGSDLESLEIQRFGDPAAVQNPCPGEVGCCVTSSYLLPLIVQFND